MQGGEVVLASAFLQVQSMLFIKNLIKAGFQKKWGHLMLAKYFILSISCRNLLGAEVDIFRANISNDALTDGNVDNSNTIQTDQ